MLLRRMISHVKTQNWLAVFLDFVIVVVGVFIGIQVSNWNEARADRSEEVGYLLALTDDVRLSLASLESMNGLLASQQSALEALYDVHRGQSDPDPEEMAGLIADGLFFLSALRVNETTFDTLVGSGRLNLIGDSDLVAALQALDSAYDATRVSIDNEYQVTYRFSDPLLIEFVDMGPTFLPQHNRDSIPWLRPGEPLTMDASLLTDRRFGNAVLYRAYFSRQVKGHVESLIADLQAIDRRVRERLDDLGYAP
ncbi:DUF6090 family protein [Aquisalinus flavus]|uniref:Uncharacterized protein n=1 Tax=Aquisalinus flavus TaxID=1526572 RepID=A0A8J2Y5N9_9PROT|nr:DUF6090 family protein [Aquisalinus flavus]MBD0425533.1 hypothetical protein [Aquisalinus flavus]UNE48838.1 hypothetical protein FF099_12655 [Aquisalinus flavus]GGD15316.1 hypothetical protein GCM10011342_25100 [Aquisalinus flavus]